MVYSQFVGMSENRSLRILHLEVTQGLVIEYFWCFIRFGKSVFGNEVNVSNKPRTNGKEQYKQLDLWTQSIYPNKRLTTK